MVVFAVGVMPDLKNHGTEAAPAPPDRTKLFRIVLLLVDDVRLIEYFLRLVQADAVLSLGTPALLFVKLKPNRLYNCYIIGRSVPAGACHMNVWTRRPASQTPAAIPTNRNTLAALFAVLPGASTHTGELHAHSPGACVTRT